MNMGSFVGSSTSCSSRRSLFSHCRFSRYVQTQELINGEYLNEDVWWRKAILNVARIGKFSSDRTVLEYARDIWHIGQFESSGRAKVPMRNVATVAKAKVETLPALDDAPEIESKQVAD